MRKLLLVEDDHTLGETLCERLQREGYSVIWCETFRDATETYMRDRFDLIILDVNLPDGSGFEFAKQARLSGVTPFLFITAMNSAEHRLEGYEIGAEEFIPKPFHLKELLLRVRHVLETHPPVGGDPMHLSLGDRELDLEAQAVVQLDGTREFIAARDFQLLKLLIDLAPKVASRDEILNTIWGEDKFPSHRTVDNAIVRLRQILGDSTGRFIRSVRGIGYQWVHSDSPADHSSASDDDSSLREKK